MDSNLTRIAELERTVQELRSKNIRLQNEVDEYKKKEQSISSAIIASMEHANQLEASRKKLYLLDIQRSRLMYLRMEKSIMRTWINWLLRLEKNMWYLIYHADTWMIRCVQR